jgi:hypothetical protein
MTAILAPGQSDTPPHSLQRGHDQTVWTVGAPRLLAGLDRPAALNLRTHLATHGPLPATDLRHLLAQLDASRLAGRAGAGFCFAAKVRR